jgi:hypothetical protein
MAMRLPGVTEVTWGNQGQLATHSSQLAVSLAPSYLDNIITHM